MIKFCESAKNKLIDTGGMDNYYSEMLTNNLFVNNKNAFFYLIKEKTPMSILKLIRRLLKVIYEKCTTDEEKEKVNDYMKVILTLIYC